MMSFDYAFQPVVAGGMVYFGSSSDHQVHALDLATGEHKWRFFTDGPVRFAPAVWQGKLYIASDDGCVYCLSAADGKLLWRFGAGPDERIMGNEQMISRWPLRNGLLVADGSVYFKAPAGLALYFQLLDADRRCLQTMRSFTGLMPGEQRGCVGCHEGHSTVHPQQRGLAFQRPPTELSPPPWARR